MKLIIFLCGVLFALVLTATCILAAGAIIVMICEIKDAIKNRRNRSVRMMRQRKRKIRKDQYDRAKANGGYITSADMGDVFSVEELCGYGVYFTRVFEKDGEYFVSYEVGDSCD